MSDNWQTGLAQSVTDIITDISELCSLLDLPQVLANQGVAAARQYPLRVSRSFVNRMEKGNPRDPLLLQILPQKMELQITDGFVKDPLEEQKGSNCCLLQKSVLQKYAGRSLLLTTNQCGMHCRFCFRRWTQTQSIQPHSMQPVRYSGFVSDMKLQDISEVILSGGDPLMLSSGGLSELLQQLKEIHSLKRIRIHTRLPVCEPQRLNAELFGILSKVFPLYIVLHINHPNELDSETAAGICRLRNGTGAVLMAQSVLLKGVNDNAAVLIKLFSMLADIGVIPYYLHQLDKVAGAAHFEVPPDEGLKIMSQLEKHLPGYAVPKYVREVPNEPAKLQIY